MFVLDFKSKIFLKYPALHYFYTSIFEITLCNINSEIYRIILKFYEFCCTNHSFSNISNKALDIDLLFFQKLT